MRACRPQVVGCLVVEALLSKLKLDIDPVSDDTVQRAPTYYGSTEETINH